MKSVYTGTSGYSYKDWKDGVFYPKGMPTSEWFEYYTQHFKTLELNITFYRLPGAAMVKRWYKLAPKDFRFVAKGSRLMTHNKKLNDPADALKVFYKALKPLKEKLKVILWQFPPQFKANPERLETFLKLLARHGLYQHVFEFRHITWFQPKVTELLKRHQAIYCRADKPEFYESLEIPDTAGFVYLRRHGPDAKAMYHHSYSDKFLKQDADEIKRWRAKRKEVYIFFNNDYHGAAIADVKKVEHYLTKAGGVGVK
jgi:uncharacterized protein YecE (DUF72 family)